VRHIFLFRPKKFIQPYFEKPWFRFRSQPFHLLSQGQSESTTFCVFLTSFLHSLPQCESKARAGRGHLSSGGVDRTMGSIGASSLSPSLHGSCPPPHLSHTQGVEPAASTRHISTPTPSSLLLSSSISPFHHVFLWISLGRHCC
jgi:hypothetical protein